MTVIKRYAGLIICLIAVILAFSAVAIRARDATTVYEQSNDLSREEQIQLMSECYEDALTVHLGQVGTLRNRGTSRESTSMVIYAFFEYRTRNR